MSVVAFKNNVRAREAAFAGGGNSKNFVIEIAFSDAGTGVKIHG